jgi:hypothetical protein
MLTSTMTVGVLDRTVSTMRKFGVGYGDIHHMDGVGYGD